RRGQQQAVQTADSVQQRHAALGQPLMRIPGATADGGAEHFGTGDVAALQDLLADHGVPKDAGVEQELRVANPKQVEPKDQEDAGFGVPELLHMSFAIEGMKSPLQQYYAALPR